MPHADAGMPHADAGEPRPNDAGSEPTPDASPPELLPPTTRDFGEVTLTTGDFGTSTRARFVRSGEPNPGCEREVIGACAIDRCDPVDPPGTPVSAGTVFWSSPDGRVDLELAPGVSEAGLGYEVAFIPSGDEPPSGTALDVRAEGVDLPAFETRVFYPEPVDFQTPEAGDDGSAVVDPAEGLDVSWQGGARGDVVVFQLERSPSGDSSFVRVECHFEATAGRGRVPAGALTALSMLEPADATVVRAYVRHGAQVQAGDYLVSVRAERSGGQGNGENLARALRFE
jgi:hypothetical protein